MSRLTQAWLKVAVFIDRWHWLVLALAAPFLLFPSPSRSPVLVIVPGLWIVAWIARRQALPRTPFNLTLLLLALMLLVSLYATYDIGISLPKIAGMVLGLGVFFALVREGQHPTGWWLCFGFYVLLALGIAGMALLGAQRSTKVSLLAPLVALLPPRLFDLGIEGGFSVNELAGALDWVIPVLILLSALVILRNKELRAVVGRARGFILSILCLGAMFFITGILVLTQSRGGYLGLGLGMLLVIFITVPRRGRWVLGTLMGLVLVVGILILRTPENAVRGVLDNGGSALSSASMIDTWEGRVEVWSRGIYGIQDFPFTGMGMNTFRHIVNVLYPFFLISPDVDIAHAHNEFLQAALDLGIPGLIAFLALYAGAFWMLWDVWRIASTAPFNANLNLRLLIRMLVLGFVGGLFAHILYGFTDVVALGAKPGILFWMMLGLIVALFEQARSGHLGEWSDLGRAVSLAAWNNPFRRVGVR